MRSFACHAPWLALGATALLLGAAPARPAPDDAALIQPNDNRTPAGRLTNGVLVLQLEARAGVWQPKGPDGPRLAVAAFAEPGKPLQTPGPLVRVASGTEVRATVRNAL